MATKIKFPSSKNQLVKERPKTATKRDRSKWAAKVQRTKYVFAKCANAEFGEFDDAGRMRCKLRKNQKKSCHLKVNDNSSATPKAD